MSEPKQELCHLHKHALRNMLMPQLAQVLFSFSHAHLAPTSPPNMGGQAKLCNFNIQFPPDMVSHLQSLKLLTHFESLANSNSGIH